MAEACGKILACSSMDESNAILQDLTQMRGMPALHNMQRHMIKPDTGTARHSCLLHQNKTLTPLFDKGIAAVPKCGLNYNAVARLLIEQNRVPEAKQKLETLIKIAPNSDGAVIAKEISATL